MSSEHLAPSGNAMPDGVAGIVAGREHRRSRTVAYRPYRHPAGSVVEDRTPEPSREPAPIRHARHRGHRPQPKPIGRVKYAWSMIAGALSFLGFYFLLFLPGSGTPAAEQLLGHLLIWPLAFLTLSALFSLLVVFGFKLGVEAVTKQTALRHYVGRKLAKLGLVVAMFNAGWLVVLFLAVLLALFRA